MICAVTITRHGAPVRLGILCIFKNLFVWDPEIVVELIPLLLLVTHRLGIKHTVF